MGQRAETRRAAGTARPAWAAALEASQRRANDRRRALTAAERRRERREATLVTSWLRELARRG